MFLQCCLSVCLVAAYVWMQILNRKWKHAELVCHCMQESSTCPVAPMGVATVTLVKDPRRLCGSVYGTNVPALGGRSYQVDGCSHCPFSNLTIHDWENEENVCHIAWVARDATQLQSFHCLKIIVWSLCILYEYVAIVSMPILVIHLEIISLLIIFTIIGIPQ